jgi:hypothetical protein
LSHKSFSLKESFIFPTLLSLPLEVSLWEVTLRWPLVSMNLSPFSNHGPVKISNDFLVLPDGLVDRLFLFSKIFGKEKGCRSTAFPLPFSWGDCLLPPTAV